MAEETLRRNLDRAFDPGLDFPHPLLLSRTMAVLAAEDKIAGRGRDRAKPTRWFSVALPRTGTRLVAAVLIAVLAVVAAGAFLALSQYVHRAVPVRPHPVVGSGPCLQGLHMTTANIGWNGESRTTDGGATWHDVGPSMLPNSTVKWGVTACSFDADHAWTTQTTGPSTDRADHVVVFATYDGGQTWEKGESVPLRGSETANGPGTITGADGWAPASGITRVEVTLQFLDDQHGWLLTDAGAYSSPPPVRSIYSTSDGGMHWTLLTSEPQGNSSVLGKTGVGCAESGITFINLERGWLTWDCSQSNVNLPPQYGGPVAAVTNDGGQSWAQVSLPSFVDVGACRASTPVFTGNRGVLPVTCSAPGSWGAIFRTDDGGATWTAALVPFPTELVRAAPDTWSHRLDFLDADTGFAFVPDGLDHTGAALASTSSELYRTTDSGRTWVVVQKGLFSGQLVDSFQFTDARTGFVFTSPPGEGPWKTTDNGLTWSYLGPPGPATVKPLNANPATPLILFSDTGNIDQIDGMTWDGRWGKVTQIPNAGFTPSSANPAGTLFYAGPNIFDRSGQLVGMSAGGPAGGFVGAWADDEIHYCQIAPLPAGAATAATGTYTVIGTLQLTTPGGTPRDVAQIGTQDPSSTTFSVTVCSVSADRAVVIQGSPSGPGHGFKQYWVLQLSTGHLLWTHALGGSGIANVIASRDGSHVAEVDSTGTTTIYGTSFDTNGVAISPNGIAIERVEGWVQGFSWDGSLAVVVAKGTAPGLSAGYGGRASVIRWSDGTVIWTAPPGQGLLGFQPEPGGSRLAILTVGNSSSAGMSGGQTVLYIVSPDGHAPAQRGAPVDLLLSCSPMFVGEGGAICDVPQ